MTLPRPNRTSRIGAVRILELPKTRSEHHKLVTGDALHEPLVGKQLNEAGIEQYARCERIQDAGHDEGRPGLRVVRRAEAQANGHAQGRNGGV
jgi:hypothetical protein